MKSERRHELQENELAGKLGEYVAKIQPYSKALIGVIAILAALVFSGFYFSGQKQKNAELSWADYFHATANLDADGLRDIADRYAGTKAAAWSFQSAGDIYLASGARTMYFDRQRAASEFISAKESYEAALAAAKDDMLIQRAIFGIAQSHEALEEYDDATKTYQRVADQWPATAIAEVAAERMDFLNLPSTREFYSWFVKQPPPARKRQSFGVGSGSQSEGLAIDNLMGDNLGLEPPERRTDGDAEADEALSQFIEDAAEDSSDGDAETSNDEPAEGDVEEMDEEPGDAPAADAADSADTADSADADSEAENSEAENSEAESTAEETAEEPTESAEESTESTTEPAEEADEAASDAADQAPEDGTTDVSDEPSEASGDAAEADEAAETDE